MPNSGGVWYKFGQGQQGVLVTQPAFSAAFRHFLTFLRVTELYPGRLYAFGRANCFLRSGGIVQGRKSLTSGGGLPGFEHSFR
jgi:hypothetical protein